jgi:hypothetical protein
MSTNWEVYTAAIEQLAERLRILIPDGVKDVHPRNASTYAHIKLKLSQDIIYVIIDDRYAKLRIFYSTNTFRELDLTDPSSLDPVIVVKYVHEIVKQCAATRI